MRNANLVILEASSEVYRIMTRTQPSVKETGGTYKEGHVPVDWGFLIGSVKISVGGKEVASGSQGQAPNYIGAVYGFNVGEDIEIAFTADYARHVEYGTSKMGGRFFVRNAVKVWPLMVARAARRYK